jgi:hypothetical protein
MSAETLVGLHVKRRLFLSDFNHNSNTSTDLNKNCPVPDFMKIGSVVLETALTGAILLLSL